MLDCKHIIAQLYDDNNLYDKKRFIGKIKEISDYQNSWAFNKLNEVFERKNVKPLTMLQLIDSKRSYCYKFQYCPICGEKINWQLIKKEIKCISI